MRILISLVMLIALAAPSFASNQSTLKSLPKIINGSKVTYYKKGYRYDKNGWIYLHLDGNGYDRGYQEGYLVAKELHDVIELEKAFVLHTSGKDWAYFRDSGLILFTPKIPPEFLDEMKGMADGASAHGYKVNWQDVLTWNAIDELTDYWWPLVDGGSLPEVLPKERCSAFLATGKATKNGKIVLGHSSWDGYANVQYYNTIVNIKPEKGHEFVMQSQVGYIESFADWFETDAGLVGAETTFAGFHGFDPNATPEFIRIRQAMQYANNLDDFANIMIKDNNGSNAAGWLVGDINSNTIMRLELGLKYHNVEKKKDGYFIGFNAPYDDKIRNLECDNTGFHDIRKHTGARRVRLEQLMQQYYGKLNVEIGKKILADQYDVYYHKINPSSRTIAGHYELDDLAVSPESKEPFQPQGAHDGKVADANLAKGLHFVARFGSPDGMAFDAKKYFAEHIQWEDYKPYVVSRPSQPWTNF